MTEITKGTDQPAQSISINKIYLKDSSFESPNTPSIYAQPGAPKVEFNIGLRHDQIDERSFEVVLSLTLTAKISEKIAFLAEAHQAGLFEIQGFGAETVPAILGIFCPTQLFPYAREVISGLIGRGGFPPITLDHVNFEQLFTQQAQQSAPAVAAH